MDNKDSNGLNIDNLMNGLNDTTNNNLNTQSNNSNLNFLNQNGINEAPINNIQDNQNNNMTQGIENISNNNNSNLNSLNQNGINEASINNIQGNQNNNNMTQGIENIPNNNSGVSLNEGLNQPVINNSGNQNINQSIIETPNSASNIVNQDIVDPFTNNGLNNNIGSQASASSPQIISTSIEPVAPVSPINNNEPLNQASASLNNLTSNDNIQTNVSDNSIVNNATPEIKIDSVPTNDIVVEQPTLEPAAPQSGASTAPNVTLSDPTVDNFASVPVPPNETGEDNKKGKKKAKGEKKKSNKLLIILLVLILIAVIGYGVYYFLTLGKPISSSSASIQTKDLRLELGAELSKNINDYATIVGFQPSSCILDTSSVDTSKVSAYKYNITCNQTKQEGTIIIDDTIAPEVVLTDVIVTPNSSIVAEDFIESCIDASSCNYEFVNEDEVLTNLTTIGEYKVKLRISDTYDNEVEEIGSLIVSNNAPTNYLNCEGEESIEDISSNKISYKFGLDATNNLFNTVKTTILSFDKEEDYNDTKDNYSETSGINGIKGKTTFNDKNYTITIVTKQTKEEVEKDLNTTLPSDGNSLRTFLTFYNYTCK